MTKRLKTIALALAVTLASSVLVASAPTAVAATTPVIDKEATVVVTPNDQIKAGRVTVNFSKAHRAANRPVQLQILTSGVWTNAGAPVAMNALGSATFWAPQPGEYSSYKALADTYLTKVAVETRPAKSLVITDKTATITMSPVAEASTGSIKATFSKAYRVKNRPVQLQIASSTEWRNVGKTVKMNSNGEVTFKTAPHLASNYRAVAAAYKGKLKAATLKATASWSLAKDYSFETSSSANVDWTTWDAGDYTQRKCSANYPTNFTTTGGSAKLRLTKTTTTATVAKARAAGCAKSEKDTYANSMEFTDGAFTMREGIVAAKVRFPKNTGMHGGIWLTSPTMSPEIDIIESYGYAGRNSKYSKVTSGIHQAMTYDEHKKLVLPKGAEWMKTYKNGFSQTVFNVRKLPASWFEKDHVVSVEFTASRLIFRMDGKKTGELYRKTPQTDYYLVMSLLTTHEELVAAKKALQTPATMTVDWVRAWVQA